MVVVSQQKLRCTIRRPPSHSDAVTKAGRFSNYQSSCIIALARAQFPPFFFFFFRGSLQFNARSMLLISRGFGMPLAFS